MTTPRTDAALLAPKPVAVDLAFEAVGDGPPLVILHGLFGAGRNWNRIARALGDRHRVYLPDARNHGASPRGQTMSYTEMAQDVLALIERERLQRPLSSATAWAARPP